MEIKTTTKIFSITKEELVNLFSTALYGSNYLDADYAQNADLAECNCFEEKLAISVLNGRKIKIVDRYAEGEVYGNLPHTIFEDEVTYEVGLDDIIKGLEKSANEVGSFANRAFWAFVRSESTEGCGEWDYLMADTLMQMIVFDNLIYG